MATPVLIIGKSGSGKSTSLRNCQRKKEHIISESQSLQRKQMDIM